MIYISIDGEVVVDNELLKDLGVNIDEDDITEEEFVTLLRANKVMTREILHDIICDYDIWIGSIRYTDRAVYEYNQTGPKAVNPSGDVREIETLPNL